jgi:hypothetical protein
MPKSSRKEYPSDTTVQTISLIRKEIPYPALPSFNSDSYPTDPPINGSLNCNPNRKYCLSGMQRRTMAWRSETDRGSCALFTKATGTSSESSVPGSRNFRVASRTPPAERLSAVANSRKSSPVTFLPRTKKGIAMGRRSQSRRSPTLAARGTQTTPAARISTLTAKV